MSSAPRRGSIASTLDAAPNNAIVQVDGHAVAFTHLDRVYWPAVESLAQAVITKRDLLRYLADVAPAMLPELRDRPLTLFRWPEGLARRDSSADSEAGQPLERTASLGTKRRGRARARRGHD